MSQSNKNFISAATGNQTVNLPNPVFGQNDLIYKKTDNTANTITLVAPSGVTIDGQTTAVLTVQNQSMTLSTDGNNYWII